MIIKIIHKKFKFQKTSDNNEIRVIFPGGSVMKEDIYHTHPYNITLRYTHTHTHTHTNKKANMVCRENQNKHTQNIVTNKYRLGDERI